MGKVQIIKKEMVFHIDDEVVVSAVEQSRAWDYRDLFTW